MVLEKTLESPLYCKYKSGPGNRGRSACGPTHVARLEFPRETGLILSCAGKVGNPLQTKQGNRPTARDQKGRRGSDEVVPGTSVVPSSETGMSRHFCGLESNPGSSLQTEEEAGLP